MSDLTIFPATVIIDTSEQAPFHFLALKDNGSPLVIRTVHKSLETGDYSLEGYEHRIAIERKSISDFFQCCGGDRERFEDQVRRLSRMEFGAVCVEADEFAIRTYAGHGPEPRSVLGTVDSWEQKYHVPFWLNRTRAAAESKTFRALRMFLKHDLERQKSGGGLDLVLIRGVHHRTTTAKADLYRIGGASYWVPRHLLAGEIQAAAGHGELIVPRWWAVKNKVGFIELPN